MSYGIKCQLSRIILQLCSQTAVHILQSLRKLLPRDLDARPNVLREKQTLLRVRLRNDVEVDVVDVLNML